MTRADRINLLRHMRSIAGITTRDKKRQRRAMRKQAALIAYLPDKAARLMRQARNG